MEKAKMESAGTTKKADLGTMWEIVKAGILIVAAVFFMSSGAQIILSAVFDWVGFIG